MECVKLYHMTMLCTIAFYTTPRPTPIIQVTAAENPNRTTEQTAGDIDENDDDGAGYFTGKANPIITPVSGTRRNVLLLPQDYRHSKTRLRTRSVGDHRPYMPPGEVVKKRLRLKMDSQLDGGTPVRRRSPSESNIDFSSSFTIPRHELGCVKIDVGGYHDCSAGRECLVHLENDFLSNNEPLSRRSVVIALEKVLSSNFSTAEEVAGDGSLIQEKLLQWDAVTVKSAMDHLHPGVSPDNEALGNDPLLHLLAKLNQHYASISLGQTEKTFDSLKILSMTDRNLKVPLNEPDSSPEDDPLVILHLGKTRALNIIPKKLNLAMMDVFDVQLDNFAILSVLSKTMKIMHVSLAQEKSLQDDVLDLHMLLIPYCSIYP